MPKALKLSKFSLSLILCQSPKHFSYIWLLFLQAHNPVLKLDSSTFCREAQTRLPDLENPAMKDMDSKCQSSSSKHQSRPSTCFKPFQGKTIHLQPKPQGNPQVIFSLDLVQGKMTPFTSKKRRWFSQGPSPLSSHYSFQIHCFKQLVFLPLLHLTNLPQ